MSLFFNEGEMDLFKYRQKHPDAAKKYDKMIKKNSSNQSDTSKYDRGGSRYLSKSGITGKDDDDDRFFKAHKMIDKENLSRRQKTFDAMHKYDEKYPTDRYDFFGIKQGHNSEEQKELNKAQQNEKNLNTNSATYDATNRHLRRHPSNENAWMAEACEKLI